MASLKDKPNVGNVPNIVNAEKIVSEISDKFKGNAVKCIAVDKHIAEIIEKNATGPISNQDWMKMEFARFDEHTKESLRAYGLTKERVVDNPKQAEEFVKNVIKMEGLPNGNGGTDIMNGATLGHYDKAGHGIDIVAADRLGVPIPIEVKKYHQVSGAKLTDTDVVRLEPQVTEWKQQREESAKHAQNLQTDSWLSGEWQAEKPISQKRSVYNEAKPKVGEYLPVQQMDELWVQDRWLKLIKTEEGRNRMRTAGVSAKYLNYEMLRTSPKLNEWKDILNNRTVAVVSERAGNVGKRMFHQAIFEKRAKRVFSIEM